MQVLVLQQIFTRMTLDPRYQRNLDWGEPRAGHPEGTIRAHIAELDQTLEKIRAQLSDEDYWKLKILIHVHDTFKGEAKEAVSISDPQSHASLAREFLAKHLQAEAMEPAEVEDLLNMVQYHDEGHALWRQHAYRGSYNEERFARLLATIRNWELFLWFLIIDGTTQGKDRESLEWFIDEVKTKTGISVRELSW
jgi:hypothetical protein